MQPRPDRSDEAVLKAAAERLLDDLARCSKEPEEILRPALLRALKKSTHLSELVESLAAEGLPPNKDEREVLAHASRVVQRAVRSAVEDWAERTRPTPSAKVGDHVVAYRNGFRWFEGRIVRIVEKFASYAVETEDGDGDLVPYEDINL